MKKKLILLIIIIIVTISVITYILGSFDKTNNTDIKPNDVINVLSKDNNIGKAYLRSYSWKNINSSAIISKENEIQSILQFLNSKEIIEITDNNFKVDTNILDYNNDFTIDNVSVLIFNDNKDIIIEESVKVENKVINIDTNIFEKNTNYYIQLDFIPDYGNKVNYGNFAKYSFKINII